MKMVSSRPLSMLSASRTTTVLVAVAAIFLVGRYPLAQALLVAKPLPASWRQSWSSHHARQISALGGSNPKHAPEDSFETTAAAAVAANPSSCDVLFGGPMTRAEAVTRAFSGVVSTAAVAADLSRARATYADGDLGVVDDLLADCPSTPTCVSSQDDRPYPFMEPWTYDGSWERAMEKLRAHLDFQGAKVIAASPRYLRVEFDDKNALATSIDDAEFYFTPGDALVQFRSARRAGPTDFGANRRRMDAIRVALNFESVPVLRNRRRALFFGESPLDSFGPSFGKMDPSVIYGDADPMSPTFETPSSALRVHDDPSSNKPAWWGAPVSRAGGNGIDWRQSPALLWLTTA